MMPHSVSMSLSSDYMHYPFSTTSMIPLPWVPHSPSPSSSPFKLFTPQIHPYNTPKLCSSPPTSVSPVESSSSSVQGPKRKQGNRKVKPNCKHIPHKDKPPHLVARRNARERRRVQAVNSAFARLRKSVPIENRNKRLSKVKTLHRAIEYINGLQAMLRQAENPDLSLEESLQFPTRRRCESTTSPDDDDLDEDDEDEEVGGNVRDGSEYPEFEDYMESDGDVVNKENEGQTWTSLGAGCESNYWTYMPYNQDYSGNIQS